MLPSSFWWVPIFPIQLLIKPQRRPKVCAQLALRQKKSRDSRGPWIYSTDWISQLKSEIGVCEKESCVDYHILIFPATLCLEFGHRPRQLNSVPWIKIEGKQLPFFGAPAVLQLLATAKFSLPMSWPSKSITSYWCSSTRKVETDMTWLPAGCGAAKLFGPDLVKFWGAYDSLRLVESFRKIGFLLHLLHAFPAELLVSKRAKVLLALSTPHIQAGPWCPVPQSHRGNWALNHHKEPHSQRQQAIRLFRWHLSRIWAGDWGSPHKDSKVTKANKEPAR